MLSNPYAPFRFMLLKHALLSLMCFLFFGCASIDDNASVAFNYSAEPSFIGAEHFKQEQLDTRVEILKKVLPKSPNSKFGKTGVRKAIVVFVVDAAGKPKQIQVLKATDLATVNRAVKCVEDWEFTPGIVNGRQVSSLMEVELDFSTRMNRLKGLKKPKYREPRNRFYPPPGKI